MKNNSQNIRASPKLTNKTTNFGLGSRNMVFAAKNALARAGKSFSSIATISQRFGDFVAFANETEKVKLMEQVTRETVIAYAISLNEKVDLGKLSPATAQNYLSAVNTVMSLARGDFALRVTAVKDAGLASRSGIAKVDKSVSIFDHALAFDKASPVIAILLQLQREIGLRFEESAKIDAKKAYLEATSKGYITVTAGTKGGRERVLPITSERQVVALKAAFEHQSANDQKSMIPTTQSYKQFKDNSYNEIRQLNINFHGERHAYAQNRYLALMGVNCPVVAGISKPADYLKFVANTLGVPFALAKAQDYAVRLQIAEELGHSRVGVTRAYLG